MSDGNRPPATPPDALARRIVVFGGGAVGCFFGGLLARAGLPVTLIGRSQHVDAINSRGLTIEGRDYRYNIPVAATTDEGSAADASLVLLCVKTTHTESAAEVLASSIAKDAVVLSFQNGVDNVDRIARFGIRAVPVAVYVAVAMAGPGTVKHSGRGDLILGVPRSFTLMGADARLNDIALLFSQSGVPCRVSENIEGELWLKMLTNCSYNAISALTGSNYGTMINHAGTKDLMHGVVAEYLAVAKAEGIQFPVADPEAVVMNLAGSMPQATSSTAQDLALGRPTEIDSLNGFIVRRAKALGIATPLNDTLFALTKLKESVVLKNG